MTDTRRHWVLIGSANGSSNLGDESMWLASAQHVRAFDPDATIVTDAMPGFSPDVTDVEILPLLTPALGRGHALPGLLGKVVSRPFRTGVTQRRCAKLLADPSSHALAQLWWETISTADGLVFTGAGGICDDYHVHGVHMWCLLADMAGKAGVPVLFVGHGIGPLTTASSRTTAARMLSNAEHVTVRAQSSRDLAIELGVDPDRVAVTGDWAVAMAIEDKHRAQAADAAQALFGGSSVPFWVVSFHRRAMVEPRRMRLLASLLSGIVAHAEAAGRRVLFVPNMTAGRYSDDRQTADLIMKHCSPAVRAKLSIWGTPGNPMLVKAVLARAEMVFTSRYHPLVFALDEGVPAVGISFDEYYDKKLEGAAALYGLTGSTFRLRADLDAATVVRAGKTLSPEPTDMVDRDRIVEPLTRFVERHRGRR